VKPDPLHDLTEAYNKAYERLHHAEKYQQGAAARGAAEDELEAARDELLRYAQKARLPASKE
jgi:hypothetical protein